MPLTSLPAPDSLPPAATPPAHDVAALRRPLGCRLPALADEHHPGPAALPCKATVCPGGCRRRTLAP